MKKVYNGVLFTDIDGTWKRDSMFLDIVKEMMANGCYSSSERWELNRLEHEWLTRKGTFESYILKAVEVFELNLRGVTERSFRATVHKILANNCQQVYRYMRALIAKKQSEGWLIHAVSASPEYAVEKFCTHWGVDSFTGTKMTIEDGVHTGERFVVDYDRKIEAVRNILSEIELTNPENIWACGDTSGDVAMMSLARYAIAVNPSADLVKTCLLKNWVMVWERKDVITERLEAGDILYSLNADNSLDILQNDNPRMLSTLEM